VATASRKLSAWKRRYRAAKRRKQAELRALERYGAAVQAELDTYAGLRTELDRWIDRFGADTIPFGRAEEQLSNALSQRQAVLAALAAMDPPDRLAGHHASLEALVDEGVRAMDNAIDGARECTADPFCFGQDFRETPDWQEFMRATADINARAGAVQSAWSSELDAIERKVKRRKLPPPPRV
jgi:hypothetical protein